MAKRKRGKGERDEESGALPTATVPLGESPERDISVYDDPPKPLYRRKIHKRRKVPRLKNGDVVEDPDPTPPADIDRC